MLPSACCIQVSPLSSLQRFEGTAHATTTTPCSCCYHPPLVSATDERALQPFFHTLHHWRYGVFLCLPLVLASSVFTCICIFFFFFFFIYFFIVFPC